MEHSNDPGHNPTTNIRATLLFPMLKWSALVLAIMAAMTLWAWQQLPADVQIPVHWGADGQPDRLGGKFEGLATIPLITLGLCFLFCLLPAIEPRRVNLARSSKPYKALWWSLLLFMLVLHSALILIALGHNLNMGRIVLIGLGVLFLVIGNFLPKVQSNFMLGIRTPWTLSSERSWYKTHRLAGWVFVATGILMLAQGALSANGEGGLLPLLIIIPGILLTLVYSWWVWRNDPDKDPRGRQ